MNSTDFKDLVPRLNALCEVYDRKPLTDAALKVWWEALEPVSAFGAHQVLGNWARTRSRFPLPGEVYEAANNFDIDRRERVVAEERATIATEERHIGATPQGREAMRLIREVIANKAKPGDAKDWARRILDRFADHDPTLTDNAFRGACAALGMNPAVLKDARDTVPGPSAVVVTVGRPV